MEDNQPKGIAFFSVKTGETRYARLEAQIQAYLNSSDIGINASRGQDFGWRLAPDWVKAVKEFRKNEVKMESLTTRNGGQKPTTVQVLYAIYGEQLRVAEERAEEGGSPFEEEYLQNIASPKAEPVVAPSVPNEIPEDVDEEDLLPPDEGADNADPSEPTDSAPSAAEPSEEVNAASDSDKPADLPEKPSTPKASRKSKQK